MEIVIVRSSAHVFAYLRYLGMYNGRYAMSVKNLVSKKGSESKVNGVLGRSKIEESKIENAVTQ